MSILIKGMEIPKSRGVYELRLFVNSDGTATVEGAYCLFEGEPFSVVPVPKHGDLIERDALLCELPSPIEDEYKIVRRIISAAPAIIPADQSDECGCGICDHCRINETGTCRYAEEV